MTANRSWQNWNYSRIEIDVTLAALDTLVLTHFYRRTTSRLSSFTTSFELHSPSPSTSQGFFTKIYRLEFRVSIFKISGVKKILSFFLQCFNVLTVCLFRNRGRLVSQCLKLRRACVTVAVQLLSNVVELPRC